MKTNQKILTLTVLSASLFLSGCGGGGSSPASTASTPAPVIPTTPVLQVTPAKLQVALTPAYPVDSNEFATFTSLNRFRADVGLGPINQDVKLDISGKNHFAFLNANATNPLVTSFHFEVSGLPGFTGVNPFDRMVYAGYAAVGATETGSPYVGKKGVDQLVATILHRNAMMVEQVTDAGIVSTSLNGTIIDYGWITPQRNASDFVGVYPFDNQTGVTLSHELESQTPFVDLEMTIENMCKTGYPVSVQSQASTKLIVTSFTITEAGQLTSLPTRLVVAGPTGGPSLLGANVAFIAAKSQLKKNTKYNVIFTGTSTGKATEPVNSINKSWSFTTGSVDTLNCPAI